MLKKIYEGREKIIEGFKNRLFPFYYDKEYGYEMKVEREIEEQQQQQKQDEKTTNADKFND